MGEGWGEGHFQYLCSELPLQNASRNTKYHLLELIESFQRTFDVWLGRPICPRHFQITSMAWLVIQMSSWSKRCLSVSLSSTKNARFSGVSSTSRTMRVLLSRKI